MAQRSLDITLCPDPFLKHNLANGFFDVFASITQVQSHYSLYSFRTRLKWLKIAQGFFVRKTSNDSRGRPYLRIDISQVTNLKSLDFTWKKEHFYWESSQVFDSHIFAVVRFVVEGVAKIIFVSVVVEVDDSPAPTL